MHNSPSAGGAGDGSPSRRDVPRTRPPPREECFGTDAARLAAPAPRCSASTRGTETPPPPCSLSRRPCPSTASLRGAAPRWAWCAARPRAWCCPPPGAAAPARPCSSATWPSAPVPVFPPPADPPPRALCARPESARAPPRDARDTSEARACARPPPRRSGTSRRARAPPPCPRVRRWCCPTPGARVSPLDLLRLGDEANVVHTRRADGRQHPHDVRVGDPTVGSEVHPSGAFGSHEGRKGGPEIRIGQGRLIHEDAALAVEGHHETRLGFERLRFSARQSDVHAPLHDRRGDHEDDQQHERDVHERRDVDVGVQGQLTVPAQPTSTTAQEPGHYSLPSRAIVP